MATYVNQGLWGNKLTDWNDLPYYPQDYPDVDKVKTGRSLYEVAVTNNDLPFDTPWADKSLTYSAFGDKCPLSKIQYYGRNLDTATNKVELINADSRAYTNYILGIEGGAGTIPFAFEGYPYGKDQFYANRWTSGGKYDSNLSQWPSWQPIVQFPVKRMVIVPYLLVNDGTWYTPIPGRTPEDTGYQYMDLKTYLANDGANKFTYPNICQVRIEIHYDISTYDPSTYDPENPTAVNPSRSNAVNARTLGILGPLHYGDNLDAWDNVDTDNIFKPFITSRGNIDNIDVPDTGVPIAGDLGGSSINSTNDNYTIWVTPVASGFGLEFDKINNVAISDATIMSNDNGYQHFSCDTQHLTIEEVQEAVRHMVACFGMFFVDGEDDINLPLDDEDMMLGTLVDGIGNGDYTHGQDNRNQPQWNWNDMHENDYDPENPSGELPDDFPSQDEYSKFEYDNTTPRNAWRPFTGTYVLDAADTMNLVKACTNHYITMQDAIEQYNDYIVEQGITKRELDLDSYLMRQWGGKANPMDCFINCIHYPFDISRYIEDLTATTFAQVGSYITPQNTFTSQTLQKTGKFVPATTYGQIDLGSITFPVRTTVTNPSRQMSAREFSSFAPYVSATLYLPFCGSVEIEPEMYCDMNIGVRYVVDWRTGSCLALVYRKDGRNNYILDQAVPGQMGDTIGISMQDTTAYASALANGVMQEQSLAFNKARNIVGGVQSGINLGMGIASTAGGNAGGISGIIGGIAGIANAGINAADLAAQTNKAQYDIGVSQVPTRRVGTASPCANSMSSMVARLTFVYSKKETEGSFNNVMGHACLWFGQVKDSSGYTECTNVKLDGIQATEVEKEMIRSLLASGVYV